MRMSANPPRAEVPLRPEQVRSVPCVDGSGLARRIFTLFLGEQEGNAYLYFEVQSVSKRYMKTRARLDRTRFSYRHPLVGIVVRKWPGFTARTRIVVTWQSPHAPYFGNDFERMSRAENGGIGGYGWICEAARAAGTPVKR